jgi:hypothetical protein
LEREEYRLRQTGQSQVYSGIGFAITAIKQALAAQQEHEPENEPYVSLASVQEPVPVFELQKSGWEIICDLDWIQTLPFGTKLYTTPPAAHDLQAELDATNRQVEILSDALAESRREVTVLNAAQPAPVREDWGPGPHEVHSLPSEPAPVHEHEPENEPFVSLASVQERTDYAVHLNHCNIGECEGVCKYLDDDCPALKHADMKAKWDRPTPPPQRQWVGLTDEVKRELIKNSALWDMHIHIGWYSAPAKSFAEKTIQLIADIEAKLKEKNA